MRFITILCANRSKTKKYYTIYLMYIFRQIIIFFLQTFQKYLQLCKD
jgi:hypothetical protein